MKRSDRLRVVERLAKQREEQAAQALAHVRAQLTTERQRLSELMTYREEYLTYLEQQGSAGISMQQWRRTQGFVEQLGLLASAQNTTISNWEEREAQLLEKWQELYQKRKNIGQFIDKISMDELVADDKAEQKRIDELVSQRFGR